MLFAYIITLIGFAAAVPNGYAPSSCKNPTKRVEWRQLKDTDKQSYINAVLCLKTKPSRLGLKTTLYDDFAYVHHKYNLIIHNVAAFLPWHRYFTHIYEGALRDCGYTGYATYWDWTKDAKKLAKSPIMSSKLGIGGDGSDTRTEILEGQTIRCVSNGPFSKLRGAYTSISPTEYKYEPHCLYRSLIDGETEDSISLASVYNATYVGIVQKNAKFASYHTALEGGPHGVIHAAMGGEMNPSTSPNDPVFFLHHAQIDRLWWQWQQANPKTRQTDYSGVKKSAGSNAIGRAALADLLLVGGMAKDVRVSDVMSTTGSVLCYTY
ncbi:hypothetical protein EDB81DRAFT_950569 [Dactylonectria macrodidyma]|uniref:Tyrosinase copper-binding domain-containing protein n=1 Tax=Dactylonectria macrodidyma TaxID=307937 RepID=A0A9P9E4D0_9HYPO|nr:hypothetical protein EDB81DRAFT_950569 [Dactylonectria macrodidyma]